MESVCAPPSSAVKQQEKKEKRKKRRPTASAEWKAGAVWGIQHNTTQHTAFDEIDKLLQCERGHI